MMWLLEGHAAPDHSTLSRFRSGPLMEGIDDLFQQLMAYLAGLSEIDYWHLFVDGTKLEAYANRYSFVWRKSVEKAVCKAEGAGGGAAGTILGIGEPGKGAKGACHAGKALPGVGNRVCVRQR